VVLGCGCVLVPGSAGRSGSRWPVRAAVGTSWPRPGPVRSGSPRNTQQQHAPKSSNIILRAVCVVRRVGDGPRDGRKPLEVRQSLRPIHMYTDRRYRSERLNHIVHSQVHMCSAYCSAGPPPAPQSTPFGLLFHGAGLLCNFCGPFSDTEGWAVLRHRQASLRDGAPPMRQ